LRKAAIEGKVPSGHQGHADRRTARVRPLDVTMVETMGVVQRIGFGSAGLLRGVDLRQRS
jgi:hypothetical protein